MKKIGLKTFALLPALAVLGLASTASALEISCHSEKISATFIAKLDDSTHKPSFVYRPDKGDKDYPFLLDDDTLLFHEREVNGNIVHIRLLGEGKKYTQHEGYLSEWLNHSLVRLYLTVDMKTRVVISAEAKFTLKQALGVQRRALIDRGLKCNPF